MLHGGPFLTLRLRREGLLWPGWPAHLWSGLGLPFLRMLLAVVSLKWSRPTVTLVTCSGGRLTLQRMGRVLREEKRRLAGAELQSNCRQRALWLPACLPSSQASSKMGPSRHHPGRAGYSRDRVEGPLASV